MQGGFLPAPGLPRACAARSAPCRACPVVSRGDGRYDERDTTTTTTTTTTPSTSSTSSATFTPTPTTTTTTGSLLRRRALLRAALAGGAGVVLGAADSGPRLRLPSPSSGPARRVLPGGDGDGDGGGGPPFTGPVAVARAAARPEPVDRPDLLPAAFSTVIDLQNFLPSGEERRLRERLADLEARTAFKLRVLTQRYPETPGSAIKAYWDVDPRTVVLVADYFAGGGSLLHFTVGEEVAALLPPRFWSVLTSSLGNRFYVSKNGEDAAILGAVDAIRTCLLSKGCAVPPQDPRVVLQR